MDAYGLMVGLMLLYPFKHPPYACGPGAQAETLVQVQSRGQPARLHPADPRQGHAHTTAPPAPPAHTPLHLLHTTTCTSWWSDEEDHLHLLEVGGGEVLLVRVCVGGPGRSAGLVLAYKGEPWLHSPLTDSFY